ncbi:variable surface protein [Plasmodium gonderi]|uniref:Variable surface protein n=1 Tax=Plasmodium gonderi TaxID=77519 RepID=A0A1Y1JSQ5_PLAGO|nr:variable surface protein [Plasmodium gonderi]GAW84468.1 variable surface protein [Plasmodium gonderi]
MINFYCSYIEILETNMDNLPSNKYINKLLQSANINDLLSKTNSRNSSDVVEWIQKYYSDVIISYNEIRKECIIDSKNQKCCRDVNYYLDFVKSIIKLSNFNSGANIDMIAMLEEQWNNKLSASDYKCERGKSVESTLRRCILKQIYDFKDDISYLDNKTYSHTMYDEYLNKKWNKIYEYIKTSIGNKKAIISNERKSESILVDAFPLNYNFLNSLKMDIKENINIKISEENEVIKELKRMLSSSIEAKITIPSESSSTEQMSYVETHSIYNNIFSAKKLLIISFIFFGYITINIMLYKFTLLGTWINNRIKCNKFIQKYICKNKTESLLSKNDYNKLNIAYKSFDSYYENSI